MIDLFVDTCSLYARIVLFKNTKLIDYYEEKLDKNLSKLFLCKLNNLFKKHNYSFNDIDKIFVANGPGSFTGIRVGLTFVKVLGWSLDKKIITLSELQIMASSRFDTKYIIPLIDARRGFVYAGVYDQDLNSVVNDSYIRLEDLLSKFDSNDVTFVSYDCFNFNTFLPNIDYYKVYKKNFNNNLIDANYLKPNYLKNTEAEDKLNNKFYDSSL